MKKIITILSVIVLFCCLNFSFDIKTVKADSLNDEIINQLEKIDLSEIEKFYDELGVDYTGTDFIESLYNIINGKFQTNYESILEYLLNLFFSKVKGLAPALLGIIAIGVLTGVIKNVKSKKLGENVSEAVFFVCFLAEIILVLSVVYSIYNAVSNTINDICKFNEILSPILLTLMVASGGGVSASIFKPAVLFISNGVANIINVIILPLICAMLVFNVISQFSKEIKFIKFSDNIACVIKWILGLVFIVFGVFLTVQGIAGGVFDGISFKATKYALSNSIPIVGGFVKDSFDLVASGSVIIKNAIGVVGVISIFYIIISPLITVGGVNLLLKTCSAMLEPVSDERISGFTTSIAKTLSYLSAALIVVGVMFFINIVMIIVCGNSALV